MSSPDRDWNQTDFHGTRNHYPFTQVVSEVMRLSPPANIRRTFRVLDLGCGGGNHLRFLAEQGFDYYGIEGNSQALKRAQDALAALGYSTSTVIGGDFTSMPFDSGFFDLVVDRGSITCNSLESIRRCAAEVHRVLKEGGRLLTWHLDILAAHELGGRPGQEPGEYLDFPGRLRDAGLLHLTSPSEISDLFRELSPESVVRHISTETWPPPNHEVVEAWTFMRAVKLPPVSGIR